MFDQCMSLMKSFCGTFIVQGAISFLLVDIQITTKVTTLKTTVTAATTKIEPFFQLAL